MYSGGAILLVVLGHLTLINGVGAYIYLLHSYFLCFVRVVLKHFIPMGNQVIEVTMGLIFSIGGCMAIGFVSKQYKWVDGIFYPQHLEKSIK